MGVLGAARRAAPGCDVHQVVVRDVGALKWWLDFCVLYKYLGKVNSLAECWPSARSRSEEIEGSETLGSSAGGEGGAERL